KHAPRQPHTLAERDRLIIHRIAVQGVEPYAMREDQAVPANPRVIADHDRPGRINDGELQDDGAAAELEARFGKLRAADVHLLANLCVLADPDRLAGDVAHRPDTGVASD